MNKYLREFGTISINHDDVTFTGRPKVYKPTPIDKEISALSVEDKKRKRTIYERLIAFRKAHGLGCYSELSKASGVPIHIITQIYNADKVSFDKWVALEKGLDAIDAAEKAAKKKRGRKK